MRASRKFGGKLYTHGNCPDFSLTGYLPGIWRLYAQRGALERLRWQQLKNMPGMSRSRLE
ncbi:MAG: hypothetical protein K2P44_07990 [Lachnospiraceae bacterium]|nr:hypothetical protein [Lachnospiraceae bacterium]